MRLLRLSLALAAGIAASGALAKQQDAQAQTDETAGIDDTARGANSPQQAPQSPQAQAQRSDQPVRSDTSTPRAPAPLSEPLSLDALIPGSASSDAAEWAAQGVERAALPQAPAQSVPANQADAPAGLEPAPDASLESELSNPLAASIAEPANAPAAASDLSEDMPGRITDTLETPFDIEAALDTLAIPQIDPLPKDPDAPSFDEIDTPRLMDVAQLQQLVLSDELIIAFPQEAASFPEAEDFLKRFRALSSIEALETANDTVPQVSVRAQSDETLLVDMLHTYGYYDAEVVRQLSRRRTTLDRSDDSAPSQRGDAKPLVRFDILPGPQYHFGAIDLGALGDLAQPDRGELRGVFAIEPGDPIYVDRIISQQSALQIALGESGYPFAQVSDPELLIDHARQEGDLVMPVAPNGKYVFGPISSSDAEFLPNDHLMTLARFDTGDVYQTSLQADLRRAILATGLVSSAVITPREVRPAGEGEPGEVALDVEITRAPLRTVSGAIGYGTQDGFKLEAGWEHRNLFPPEGALIMRGVIGTREQLGAITFRRNNFLDRDQILTLDAYASDIETEAVEARTVAVRAAFERVSNLLFQKPMSWQVGAEFLYSDERNRVVLALDTPLQSYTIGSLFGTVTFDSSDDLLDPTHGVRATAYLAPEFSRSLGEETLYLSTRFDLAAYRPVGTTIVAGRMAVATIQGAQISQIAPSRRLYAGGGGSVRGYGYQAIGPRNITGEPTGGASLIEVAVEARIPTGLFGGAVEVVPFIDAGSVSQSSTPGWRDARYGAGLGVRYKTSFGPIRVDLGVPLNPTEFDASVAVYVSLGQAF